MSGMTRREAINFLKNMMGEENGRMISATGFYRRLLEYHVEALSIAIACLQHEVDNDEKSKSEKSCLNCGTSECELGNRARYGFCGNWTERR